MSCKEMCSQLLHKWCDLLGSAQVPDGKGVIMKLVTGLADVVLISLLQAACEKNNAAVPADCFSGTY